MITNSLKFYFIRFYKEVLLFWIIVFVNGYLTTQTIPFVYLVACGQVELVMLIWITLRIVLAEDGFNMQGGWKTRPIHNAYASWLALAVASAVVLITLIVRSTFLFYIFHLSNQDIGCLLGSMLVSWFIWFIFALLISIAGKFISDHKDEIKPSIIWSGIAILVSIIAVCIGNNYYPQTEYLMGYRIKNHSTIKNGFLWGIKNEIKDAKNFVGDWFTESEKCPKVKIAYQVNFFKDEIFQGFRVVNKQVVVNGSRVKILCHFQSLNNELGETLLKTIPILKFNDGSYAVSATNRLYRKKITSSLMAANQIIFIGDFYSPMCLPEFDGDVEHLIQGLELRFYIDEPSENDKKYEVASKVVFNPKSRDELFSFFPWSDDDFQKVALPFLMKHATDTDKDFLLGKLKQDMRLMEVFQKKNWLSDAMPILKERAKEHLDLEMRWVQLLANEKDAALNKDLMVIALNHLDFADEIENCFRDKPGVDWSAFSKEAWRRVQNPLKWYGNLPWWTYAFWAAQEGEATALRKIAVEAANGKKWENDKLKELVVCPQENVLEFVKLHFDDLKFNAEKKKWE